MAALSQSPGKPQGQTNSGVLLETTEVVVDVVVRDKKGQPVKDLTQADFQVYEDDALQKIKSFRLIARDPCLSCDGGMVNLIALVFDRLSPEACILARQAAMKYVNENLKPSDMVGVFAVDASLRTLQLYTNDADLIRRGIDRALSQCSSNPYGSGKAEKLAPQYVKIKSGCRPQPLAPLASDPVLVRKETIEALEHDRQGYAAVASLLDVIRGLHNATGRKAVIYFSEGVAISTAVQSHFRAVISAANRANVSIYAIDVAGLRVESGTADARREIDDIVKKRMTQLEDGVGEEMGRPMMRDLERNEKLIRLDPSASLSHLAHETGGFFINNTNDLAAGLRRIDEEIRTHYVMTYEPANTNYDGNFRQIRVKLNRADLRAQTRKGYYALKPGTRAQPLDYEVPALAALNSITLPASFPLRAAGFHFPEADQPTLAPALVEVPAIAFTFTPDNGKKVYRADFSILVLIKGRSGQVFRKLSKHYQLTGPLNKLEEARRGNILFYRDAQLEPGRYTLHAVAYDAPSGKASARTLELEVPDLGEKQPGMSSLVILKGVERLGAGERQAANPFHYGEVVVYPNLGEPLRKDRTKQLAFYYTAYPRQGFTALRQTVEVLQHGRVIGRVTGELPAPDAAGRIQYASALPLDALPLQHGEYELKVTVFEGNEAVSRSARFVIEDAAGAGVPTLELRQPVERELAAGQAHAYRVNLAAGQYLSVAVNQKGIDVEVVLLGPDGNLLNSNNEAGGPQGTERLSWIAESAGSYGLEVRPALEKGVAGRYEIHIEELRTPTEKEKLSAAALRISQEALKLYDPHQKQDAESRRQAIARHQEALALYRRAEDQQGQAIALLNLGDDYRRLKDQQKAQESYEGALFHARAAGARSLEAYILISLGRLYEGSDPPDKQKTQTYYEQALAIYQETGDIEWQMSMLNNLAGIYLELGDPDKAIATYEQEIKLGQAYGIVFSAPAILAKYMTTAQMFTAMGEVDKAAEYYAKALEVSKALEEKGGMRQWVHTSLALTYRKLGDRQKELVYWYQALAHAGHRAEEMIALLAIAGVYAQFEDRQRAQQYLDRVLQIGRAILEKDEDWRTLQILGWAYSMMGDKRKALDHFEQALALNRAASREGEAGGG
ncbi:MAG TPA: VWA domain-containing protein, partial [Blastocatellia bacterium]|nr:VWA domain-containing protein [Blastocatellia bacterium]